MYLTLAIGSDIPPSDPVWHSARVAGVLGGGADRSWLLGENQSPAGASQEVSLGNLTCVIRDP